MEIENILQQINERLDEIEKKQKEIYCSITKMSHRIKLIRKQLKKMGGKNDRFYASGNVYSDFYRNR
ncbi:MAG: hypothetical protein QXF86_03135 [Candidatus Bilamarchaeaceae archaeon]